MLWLLLACAPKTPVLPPAAEPVDPFPEMVVAEEPAVWAPSAPELLMLGPAGPKTHLHTDHSLPLVHLRVLIPGGSIEDPGDRAGLCTLGAAMLEESAGGRSTLERADALADLAADFSVSCGRESLTVQLGVHADRLAPAMQLMAEALTAPGFVAADFARVQEQQVQGLRSALDSPATVASEVARRVLFTPEHPYGTPPDGTPESAGRVTLDDVKQWYSDTVHSGGVEVAVAGAIDGPAFTALWQDVLGDWQGKPVLPAPIEATPPAPGFYFVDVPGASQTAFRIAHPGPAGDSDALGALDLARIVLGGSFTSRLNRRLREELGYTYGARVSVTTYRQGGMVQAYAGIRADATADALQEFQRLLGEASSEGFSSAELAKARSQAVTASVSSAETLEGLTGAFIGEVRAGRDPAELLARAKAEAATDGAAAQQAVKDWLDIEQATVVLVGDAAAVMPGLEAAGYGEWTMLDRFGEPVE